MFNPLKAFINLFKPPRPISWQTFISMSCFSWAFSIFAYSLQNTMVAAHFTNNCALIFFMIGIFWLQAEKKWKFFGVEVRPIIIGVLISVFLFKASNHSLFLIGIFGPMICGLVAIIPDLFTQFKPTIPPPDKQLKLINIMLIYILVSCWFGFYFFLQDWLLINDRNNKYLSKNFYDSMFVVRVIPASVETFVQKTTKDLPESREEVLEDLEIFLTKKIKRKVTNNVKKNGEEVIEELEKFLQTQTKKQSWETVEFLVKQLDSDIQSSPVKKVLDQILSDSSWSVKVEVEPQQEKDTSKISEYNFNLWVIWKGADEYRVKKSCKIERSDISIFDPEAKVFAELTCQKPEILTGNRE